MNFFLGQDHGSFAVNAEQVKTGSTLHELAASLFHKNVMPLAVGNVFLPNVPSPTYIMSPFPQNVHIRKPALPIKYV